MFVGTSQIQLHIQYKKGWIFTRRHFRKTFTIMNPYIHKIGVLRNQVQLNLKINSALKVMR